MCIRDSLGYGYIGICAENICMNGEPGSEASKNLRKGFATLFSVYRDTVVNSYYGETAAVIQYPVSYTHLPQMGRKLSRSPSDRAVLYP